MSWSWLTSASRRGESKHPLHLKNATNPAFFSIVVEAYSPLGSTGSPLMKDETVLEIAKKNNVEPGTVLLSYLVNRDIVGA